ncbi:helix-turn-helix transcriptional regulator [Tissierella sp. Yu-01]|uniref:helix-turn-helix domain-containing protein n=1 Tax=Tissierella sp. Yu-01 TaxID=3035694 RepID=UPI00240DCC92|nr:helix-turn-helix transcriptional regulator [Tissierella sp. Yu-01]WFA08021.1 helix-turn-helix transcriptional regulator [Tissierella sp. Yu-01]
MKLILDSKERNMAGSRVRIARLKNNFTQQELSAKLETLAVYVDRASISKIEHQKRIITDIELAALSRVLKVSVDWLLGVSLHCTNKNTERLG